MKHALLLLCLVSSIAWGQKRSISEDRVNTDSLGSANAAIVRVLNDIVGGAHRLTGWDSTETRAFLATGKSRLTDTAFFSSELRLEGGDRKIFTPDVGYPNLTGSITIQAASSTLGAPSGGIAGGSINIFAGSGTIGESTGFPAPGGDITLTSGDEGLGGSEDNRGGNITLKLGLSGPGHNARFQVIFLDNKGQIKFSTWTGTVRATSGILSATASDTVGLGAALFAKVAGTIASPQVAFGTGTNTIGGSANFTWDGTSIKLGAKTLFSATGITTVSGITHQDLTITTAQASSGVGSTINITGGTGADSDGLSGKGGDIILTGGSQGSGDIGGGGGDITLSITGGSGEGHTPQIYLNNGGASTIRFGSYSGILKGSTGVVSVASAGSDYQAPIPLTFTALATGFSIAGGTSSRTLTVDETRSVSAYAIGPGSSTANRVAKFSGTDGRTLAASGVTIDAGDAIRAPNFYIPDASAGSFGVNNVRGFTGFQAFGNGGAGTDNVNYLVDNTAVWNTQTGQFFLWTSLGFNTNNLYDIGSSGKRAKDLYLAGLADVQGAITAGGVIKSTAADGMQNTTTMETRELAFKLSRTGATHNNDIYLYMPSTSTDLKIFTGGSDKLVLTRAGNLVLGTTPGVGVGNLAVGTLSLRNSSVSGNINFGNFNNFTADSWEIYDDNGGNPLIGFDNLSGGLMLNSFTCIGGISAATTIESGVQNYGELYADNVGYTGSVFDITMTTSGTVYPIKSSSLVASLSSLTTLSTTNGTITVLRSGRFLVSFDITYTQNSSNIITHFGVYKGGSLVLGAECETKNINSTDQPAISKTWVIDCTANDVLDIRADASASGLTLGINHYSFMVYRIN